MTMKNPPHPGLSVRHDCINPLDLSITEAADILGVTRQTLNNLVNGKSGISPECQSALKFDPRSASNRDPSDRLGRRDQTTTPFIDKRGHCRKPLSDGFDVDHHYNI
jgi:addiction module HigA family antidote